MTEAHPLHWPQGWPRTPPEKQDRGYQFKQTVADQRKLVSFARARDLLYEELRRLGGTHPVVSTNHPADRYGIPTESKRRVQDEGVAVYFQLKGKPMAMACDRFDNAAANMRSLGLAIEAMRQLERHGGGVMMERAFQGFEALPPPRSPWDILGVRPGSSEAEIRAAWRRLVAEAHPDRGGSEARTAELNAARDAALKEARA